MTKSRVRTALDELRVAADVCELDENSIIVRQAVRIRAARSVLAQAIEAATAGETPKSDSTEGESAVVADDAPITGMGKSDQEGA